MQLKINWRFLAKFSAATLLMLIAIHLAHGWQARRQVGAFLRQADAARDAKDRDEQATEREVTYLKRYLAAKPSDTDVHERLARLICRSAKSNREIQEGYLVAQDVLRRDPTRDDLRKFSIDFAMNQLNDFPSAISDIDILLQKHPKDGELKAQKARCLALTQKYEAAAKLYGEATELRHDLVDAYPLWAAILRTELKNESAADEAVAKMLDKNRENFRAHLLVASYWRTFWRLDQDAARAARAVVKAQGLIKEHENKKPNDTNNIKVIDAINQAVMAAKKLAPEELDVIIAASDALRFESYKLAQSQNKTEREQAKAKFSASYNQLKAGLAKHPQSPALYLALAAREAEQRQEKEPVAVIKEGLTAVPDSAPLALALVDYQIRAGDAPGATETLAKLKGRGLLPAEAGYYESRIQMLREQWAEAATGLDYVRNNVPNNPALGREANLLLGRCYEQLGQLDRRLDAFTRAVPTDTTDVLWIPALLGVAEAEAALGKIDASLQTYMKLKDRVPGTWLQIARIRMAKELQAPADKKRGWRETEEALKIAEDVFPKDNAEVRILRARLLAAQGSPNTARTQLEALRSENPKDSSVWLALVDQDLRDKNWKGAVQTLDAAEKAGQDSPALRLARARLWVETRDEKLTEKFETLANATDKFTHDQQRLLLRGLAELAPAPLNSRLWDRLAALRPLDLNVQLTRFDLALSSKDEDKVASVLRAIRKINGEADSAARLCQAIYLIWRAQYKQDMAGLSEAEGLLAGLERERGEWGRVAFARALIHDLRGHYGPALVKYRHAVAYGEASPDAIRRLLELLRNNGNLDEIASVLQKVAQPNDPTSLRIAAEAALHAGNVDRAVELAERAVPASSTDHTDHIWLGQIYFSAGRHPKAETALRKATGIRPESPDGWLPLIQYLAVTKRTSEAEKILDEAQGKVSPPERSLFLGSAYAFLGKEDKAREAHAQARAERPEHPGTVRAEAVFLYQHPKFDPDKKNADAIEAFRRLLVLPTASADDRDYARQMIAICFASSPDYAVSRQALSELGLLQGNQLRPLTGTESPAERRARILALAFQRERENRLEAIQLLEKSDSVLTPDDQFLLAQLHRSVGHPTQVRTVMAGLLKKNGRVARYVQFYAGWLLQAGDHVAAKEWVDRLIELQPDALVTAELRARLAVATGDTSAARAILVPRANAPDAPVPTIARVCESLKLYEDAERLFRRAVEKAKEKQPDAPLLLAAFHGRRGQTPEALRICDEVRKKAPVLTVAKVAVEALYDSPAPSRTDTEHVAAWLSEASTGASGATKALLTQLLASVRNLQGDYAGAMKLYTDAISANNRDALALNNLAFLVAAKDRDYPRALKLIEQAKEARGPFMDLLDTEALIRIETRDFRSAQALLETVTAEAPSGTAFYHLARVELELGDKSKAKSTWRRAQELGVKLADLHPLERPEFERVSALLK